MTGDHIQPLKRGKCIIYLVWFRGGKKMTTNTSRQLGHIRPSLCVSILLIENRAVTGRGQQWLYTGFLGKERWILTSA